MANCRSEKHNFEGYSKYADFVAYVRGFEGDNEWLSAIGVRVRTSLASFWDQVDGQVGSKKDMASRKSQQRLE